ncbi:hypothetical protein ABEDC_1029 [Acinetobacter lwoffii]|nr:hypothetical protein ABEDC_1029 [Acinetobacter lwoffii]
MAQELHQAKQENDNLRTSSASLIKQLEFALEQNKKSGKSERVFAIRYCIGEIKKTLRGASD